MSTATLGGLLDAAPTTKTLNRPTVAQRTILNLLERGDEFVLVSGVYIAFILHIAIPFLVLVGLWIIGKKPKLDP